MHFPQVLLLAIRALDGYTCSGWIGTQTGECNVLLLGKGWKVHGATLPCPRAPATNCHATDPGTPESGTPGQCAILFSAPLVVRVYSSLGWRSTLHAISGMQGKH
jgi:hypothetical protein